MFFFVFQAEDGIRDHCVTGVQTCALPIYILEKQKKLAKIAKLKRGRGKAAVEPVLAASGATGQGIKELLRQVMEIVREHRAKLQSEEIHAEEESAYGGTILRVTDEVEDGNDNMIGLGVDEDRG